MAKINKFDTPEFRKELIVMTSKTIITGDDAETAFTSYRTPDNKHFFLVPNGNPDYVRSQHFGFNLKSYEVDYVLLGQLGMVK